jgi:hypothetical protein
MVMKLTRACAVRSGFKVDSERNARTNGQTADSHSSTFVTLTPKHNEYGSKNFKLKIE